MNNNIVIGVEGLVGAGKTTLCKALVNYMPNTIVLHAGDVYRAVVYRLMQEKDIKKEGLNIKEMMVKFKINLRVENKETVVYFGDEKVDTDALQSDEVSLAVSKISNVANNSDAYLAVCGIIDKLKEKYNVIFSGRDTMKIYPNLDYHFFIVADLEERVRRKRIQYNNEIDYEVLKKHIEERDALQEKSGYYNTYENTITIDVTNCKSIDEATALVLKHIDLNKITEEV